MRLTSKELRQLLANLAEEEPSLRAQLIKDRHEHLMASNPDLLIRLQEVAWNHIFRYNPFWPPNKVAFPGVKEAIPFLLKKGVKPKDIVPYLCEPYGLYKWAFEFDPDLLRTDQDKNQDPYYWCREDLIAALNKFNATYEERINYLGALEELMDFAFTSEEKPVIEDKQTLKLLYRFPEDAESLFNLMRNDFIGCESKFNELLHNEAVNMKLDFNGSMIKLVNIFRRGSHNYRFIMTKKELATWIIQSFTVENKELTYGTVYDYLSKWRGCIENPNLRYQDIPGFEHKAHEMRYQNL